MNIGFFRVVVIVIGAMVCMAPSSGLAEEATVPGSGSNQIRLLDDGEYFPCLLNAIDGATREIVMAFFLFKTNGYNTNYPDRIATHLVGAAERGVGVSVILERGKDPRDMVDRSNRDTAERLKKGGVRVSFDSPRTTTHTKTAVIDRRFVFLGSHNLTNSALKYNHELSLFVDSPSLAGKVLEYIGEIDEGP